jgi:hypothetical protein
MFLAVDKRIDQLKPLSYFLRGPAFLVPHQIYIRE